MISGKRLDILNRQQEALRNERLSLEQQQREVQSKIDAIELEKHDISRFIGKAILLKSSMKDNNSEYLDYMVVENIDRAYSGPRFNGTTISISNDKTNKASLSIQENTAYQGYYWEEVDNIKFVELSAIREEVKKSLKRFDFLNI